MSLASVCFFSLSIANFLLDLGIWGPIFGSGLRVSLVKSFEGDPYVSRICCDSKAAFTSYVTYPSDIGISSYVVNNDLYPNRYLLSYLMRYFKLLTQFLGPFCLWQCFFSADLPVIAFSSCLWGAGDWTTWRRWRPLQSVCATATRWQALRINSCPPAPLLPPHHRHAG